MKNKKLKAGLTEMAKAAYKAVFEACHYGDVGSNSSWFDAYAAYGLVGKVYGKFFEKTEKDKDSGLWGDAKI